MKYFLLLFLCSCSTTVVTVNKTVFILGKDNAVELGGSSLKDNSLSQKARGELELPLQ